MPGKEILQGFLWKTQKNSEQQEVEFSEKWKVYFALNIEQRHRNTAVSCVWKVWVSVLDTSEIVF